MNRGLEGRHPSLDDVRALLRDELENGLRGAELIRRCTALSLALARSNVASEVPHAVWHYLHDADIRGRDAEYAKGQLGSVAGVLRLSE